MSVTTFIHGDGAPPTTLSEIRRVHDWVESTDFFGVYAYATQSGVLSFDLAVGPDFWLSTPSRWLFGVDYGRTHPQALRNICEKENAEVRIYDGTWLVDQEGFLPRRDFHAKLTILSNPDTDRYGMVVGSGNFSSNGLRKSVEAGASLWADNEAEYLHSIEPSVNVVTPLWELATPVFEVLDSYEKIWRASFLRGARQNRGDEGGVEGPEEIFWIEAGYVTRNRGAERPGNQIDLPRRMSRYFGFNPPDNLPINSIIGEITFETPVGEPVTRNLRLGNNHMEKITLPIPETHGFDIYDGKVLVFQVSGDRYVMRALEADDFETAFGDRLSDIKVMNSGRRFGHIEG